MEKDRPTLSRTEYGIENPSVSTVAENEILKEYAPVIAVINAKTYDDREAILWVIKDYERLKEEENKRLKNEVKPINEPEEKYIQPDMPIEGPKFSSEEKSGSIEFLKKSDQEKGLPPLPPRWNRPYSAYSTTELRALKFESVAVLDQAIKLCWHDPDLKGVPRDTPDGITLIVPEEAIKYFTQALKVPEVEEPPFTVSKVYSPSDIPREKLAEMRRKYGM